MARMIVYPRESLDHRRHPRQGPQLRLKPVHAGTLAKRAVDPLEGGVIQLRFSTRAACTPQGRRTAASPVAIPAAHALAAGPQCPRHRGQDLTRSKLLGGLPAPLLQRVEVPSLCYMRMHALIIREGVPLVTLFCEIH